MQLESWPCRFVAKHQGPSESDAVTDTVLDYVDTQEEGRSRAAEMMRAAKAKHGQYLMWIDLQEIGEDGEWAAIGRFYPEESIASEG